MPGKHARVTPLPSRTFLRALLLLALATLGSLSFSQQIRGTLSNFDAQNQNNATMTNLELDLRLIEPSAILSFYQGPNGWGLPPIVRDVGGTEVTWADFRAPILPGQMRHFGLNLAGGAAVPCGVQAYWTRHLKVIELPVPWQTWRAEPGRIIDVIRLSPDFGDSVLIQREWAVVPFTVPLDDLIWDNPIIPWQPVTTDPVLLPPGGVAELPLLVSGGGPAGAVLVRYTVAPAVNPENVVVRFVNEAPFEALSVIPTILGSLSNFDVRNDTGKPVHDLELDLLGIGLQDIVGWYRGPLAWGLHPIGGDPTIRPLAGGVEVNWVDEWNPMQHGETRHFGLRLGPQAPEPLVRAFWTRVVKVQQIPVPWQWWQRGPGEAITDVIQLSDTFDGPVTIRREWARMEFPVPLDELVWDNPAIPWNPDPAGPVDLSPGDQTSLTIPVASLIDAAVLVRYTVSRGPTATPEVRFVNEAILGPMTDQPAILGSLSNFDVVNLTQLPMTNLELDLRAIQPEQIVGWYAGPMSWGLHPTGLAPAIRRLAQAEVTWADFRQPLLPGQTRHFGVELVSDAPPPCGVQAYWTQHRKIVEIPVPWQTWRADAAGVVDVIRLSADFAVPVRMVREWAVLPFRVPLDDLIWDNPSIPWQPDPSGAVVLYPGGTTELLLPGIAGMQAALVRYTVEPLTSGIGLPGGADAIVVRFVNEAEIETFPTDQPPAIVGSLSNFDARNDTGKPVHDLELDLVNVPAAGVLDWFRGPGAWGIDPVIRALGTVNGTEVTWVDDRNPMLPGETRHFGLILQPGGLEPLVRAFWTREVKVAQIPVPWQFWLVPPGSIVRDVVQLSDTFTEPVVIRREFATTDTLVPLDRLNYDLPAAWVPDPAGPTTLAPGFQADLDIPVDPTRAAAVLVRYQVALENGTGVVTRFANEAMLGPGVVSGLKFRADNQTMDWNPSPMTGAHFDMVRGSISNLRPQNGIADAACIGEDIPVESFFDVTVPPSRQGFYYLVRAETADGEHGTYDSFMDPALREGRDLEIGPGDCL